MILVTRKRTHPATIAYIERRLARRQDTTRSKPLPQALPRPQPLPPTRTRTADRDLTDIEASLGQTSVAYLGVLAWKTVVLSGKAEWLGELGDAAGGVPGERERLHVADEPFACREDQDGVAVDLLDAAEVPKEEVASVLAAERQRRR